MYRTSYTEWCPRSGRFPMPTAGLLVLQSNAKSISMPTIHFFCSLFARSNRDHQTVCFSFVLNVLSFFDCAWASVIHAILSYLPPNSLDRRDLFCFRLSPFYRFRTKCIWSRLNIAQTHMLEITYQVGVAAAASSERSNAIKLFDLRTYIFSDVIHVDLVFVSIAQRSSHIKWQSHWNWIRIAMVTGYKYISEKCKCIRTKW